MTTTTSIPLTIEQLEVLNGTGGAWLKLTEEQRALVESCGPGETVVMYGAEFVRTSSERYRAALDSAYEEAGSEACRLVALKSGEPFEMSAEDRKLGATHVRATITCPDGRKATGVGKIPDLRSN